MLLRVAVLGLLASATLSEESKEMPQGSPINLPKPFDLATTCHPNSADVIFVLDRSGSISAANFQTVKEFVVDFAKASILSGPTLLRLGVVTFDDAATLNWNLDMYEAAPPGFLEWVIRNLPPPDFGRTDIAAGMNRAAQAFKDAPPRKAGHGPEAENKVMIIITDGFDDSDVATAHEAAVEAGLDILGIGIWGNANDKARGMAELVSAVGDRSRVIELSSFDLLAQQLGTVCREIDNPCIENPCQNGATCVKATDAEKDRNFRCLCPPGFSGEDCQHDEAHPCKNVDCNQGTCRPHGSDGGYYCDCDAGWKGSECDQPFCFNDQDFECDCDYGYTGEDCSEVVDFCNQTIWFEGHNASMGAPDFCGPNGHCESIEKEGLRCQCDPDWTGRRCDTPLDHCAHHPCQHGGTCVNRILEDYECPEGVCHDGPSYYCHCTLPYTGPNCERERDACRNYTVPINGVPQQIDYCVNGDCFTTQPDDPHGAQCSCYDGWQGTRCDQRIKSGCDYTDHNGVEHSYPQGAIWIDDCNECRCDPVNIPDDPYYDGRSKVRCAHSLWCPHRCAIYETEKTRNQNLTVGCPTKQNCIPDVPACAANGVAKPYGNPLCDFPAGWCFPAGHVMMDSLAFPTNPPAGYVLATGKSW